MGSIPNVCIKVVNMIDKHREIFTKVWNAYRQTPNPKTDREWELLLNGMQEIRKTYNCELANDLINAVLAEIERHK